MPAVREGGDEAPEKLERVEVRPGVFLKLNAADRKVYADLAEKEATDRAAWEKAVVGDAPAATADATPEADAPDAEEAVGVAAPKPRSKSRK